MTTADLDGIREPAASALSADAGQAARILPRIPAPSGDAARAAAGTERGPGEPARAGEAGVLPRGGVPAGAGLSPGMARSGIGTVAVAEPAILDETRAAEGAGTSTTGPLRFVALGDSLTQGVGDPVDGGWRGWAALLADGVGSDERPAVFRNLAVSGALSRDVAEHQAPQALEFGPDIASVVVGVNDTLRRTFDIGRLTHHLDEVCGALAAHGAVLLTACLPDPGAMFALPAPLARPLARRQRAVNAVVHALSDRYGAVHLHIADPAWVADRSMWSADRLHPGERGHRMLARSFHDLLSARGLVHGPPPSTEPDRPRPTRAEALLWLATAGTGWVARRCTDLIPQLLRLAGDEMQHWARGTSARLDRSAEHALSAALAAVSPEPPFRPAGARMGE